MLAPEENQEKLHELGRFSYPCVGIGIRGVFMLLYRRSRVMMISEVFFYPLLYVNIFLLLVRGRYSHGQTGYLVTT